MSIQILPIAQGRWESRLRARAKRRGLVMRKSRAGISIDNQGGYMLVDLFRNTIVAGEKFNLTLEDVEAYLE